MQRHEGPTNGCLKYSKLWTTQSKAVCAEVLDSSSKLINFFKLDALATRCEQNLAKRGLPGISLAYPTSTQARLAGAYNKEHSGMDSSLSSRNKWSSDLGGNNTCSTLQIEVCLTGAHMRTVRQAGKTHDLKTPINHRDRKKQ